MDQASDKPEETELSATDVDALLAQLIASMGAGARAIQGLPLAEDFEYHQSFPEFANLLQETRGELLDTLRVALGAVAAQLQSSEDDEELEERLFRNNDAENIHNPLLWEACADACDILMEEAESQLMKDEELVSNASQFARKQATKSFASMIDKLVDMPKPQEVYPAMKNLYRYGQDRNERTTPFVPPIVTKHHAVVPLDLELQPGSGYETRLGKLRANISIASNTVLPKYHVPHVYNHEISNLNFEDYPQIAQELQEKPPAIFECTPLSATWVDTPEALQEMVNGIKENGSTKEIAIDLEAHSYRSFAGFTCLIQMSFRAQPPTDTQESTAIHNFLIDPFPLWDTLGETLGKILADPKILKILHGADNDVQWLQRDFGLYLVNMFDTGRAARALRLESAGYGYLLQRYARITADKSQQLADWRQRPLPDDLRQYAIMDTHYLLDIYQHLRWDLVNSKETSYREVWDVSQQVALIRYSPEPFSPDGWEKLRNSSRKRRPKQSGKVQSEWNDRQEAVMKALWDWRDATARRIDESVAYVCSNSSLVRLAMACPTQLSALQGLFNPMPPILLQESQSILRLVQQHSMVVPSTPVPPKSAPRQPLARGPVGAPSSAFFKPAATAPQEEPPRSEGRNLMSPVLGTEALYKQAGWMTPLQQQSQDDYVDPIASTTEEEEEDEDGDGGSHIPRKILAVHPANQSFRAHEFTKHSLKISNSGGEHRGPAALRAIPHDIDKDDRVGRSSGTDDPEVARHVASQIRTSMVQDTDMMGLISTPTLDDEITGGTPIDTDVQRGSSHMDANTEEEFPVPRSMREIYRISNRNRKNKKTGSPIPGERAGTPASEKDTNELLEAEEILKARGLDGSSYFDDASGSPKRQRTKSVGNASVSSEEAGGNDSQKFTREDDIALMKDIGWIESKQEIENLLERKTPSEDTDSRPSSRTDTSKSGRKSKEAVPFDYSSIGGMGLLNSGGSSHSNPFFAGAALSGGHLTQQTPKGSTRKKSSKDNTREGKLSAKGSRRQVERPEKQDGRSQAFRKV